ncbi:TPA: hypothetical protein ACXNIY_000406 [Stenotrophomonas maltophilia]
MNVPVARKWLLVALMAPASVMAAKGMGKVINAADRIYKDLTNVVDASIGSDLGIRQAAMFQMVGAYRLSHGLASVKRGETITFIWPDGSAEKGLAADPFLTTGIEPIPGTQMTKKQMSLRCGSCHNQYK